MKFRAMHDYTRMLNNLPNVGGREAEVMLAELYGELRRMAAGRIAGEDAGHTLQATALVNEAYLRIARPEEGWANRAHFFAAASEAMRRILIESARRRLTAKRGGGAEHVPLNEAVYGLPLPDDKLLLIHEALDVLESENPSMAEVVKMHVFVGLRHKETAALLEISERTVRRYWKLAKLRLHELIRENARAMDGKEDTS